MKKQRLFNDLLDKDYYQIELSLVARDIIQTLVYFNIFNYPLKAEEILINSSIKKLTISEVKNALEELIQKHLIIKSDTYYKPQFSDAKIKERILGNIRAVEQLKIAKRMGRFIASFPFVRGVFISGSLSKGVMQKDSDIDFFVVTAPSRLWLSRTLLILFKKIFLFNSKKYFCPNYFIDTQHLEIPEKNLFTAKELHYLIPVYNNKVYNQILDANKWTLQYMPNFPVYKNKIFSGRFLLKALFEKLLSGSIGEYADNFCMRTTENFWRKKHKDAIKGDLNIRCKKYVAKFHPKGFQERVLQKYSHQIIDFEKQFRVNLAND